MKKWLIICLVVAVIAVVAAGVLGYKVYSANQVTEEQLVAVAWAQSHSKEAKLLGIAPQNKFWIIYWQEGETITMTLFINGESVDVKTQKVNKP